MRLAQNGPAHGIVTKTLPVGRGKSRGGVRGAGGGGGLEVVVVKGLGVLRVVRVQR